jgi:hypothetical protein
MSKVHLTAWILVVVGLVAFGLAERHAGAATERANRLYDSLTVAQAKLDTATKSALAQHSADSLRDAQRLRDIQGRASALAASNGRLATLAGTLRASADSAQRVVIDSLEGLHAQREASLAAQRDSALALFRDAAAARDTLAGLLRAQQVQLRGLQDALVASRRKPFLERGPFPVAEKVLALYGLARLVRP